MKLSKILYFLIAYLTSFTSFQLKPVYSSATILNCNSKIPKGVPCLIKASSYNVEIEKVDICPKNPFPDFRTTPDYAGSLCLNLYDKKIDSGKLNLRNNSKLELPEKTASNREYKYISIIFKINLQFQVNSLQMSTHGILVKKVLKMFSKQKIILKFQKIQRKTFKLARFKQ